MDKIINLIIEDADHIVATAPSLANQAAHWGDEQTESLFSELNHNTDYAENSERSFHIQQLMLTVKHDEYVLVDGKNEIVLQNGDLLITPKNRIRVSIEIQTTLSSDYLQVDTRSPLASLQDVWSDNEMNPYVDNALINSVVPMYETDQFDPLGFLNAPHTPTTNDPFQQHGFSTGHLPRQSISMQPTMTQQPSPLQQHFEPPQVSMSAYQPLLGNEMNSQADSIMGDFTHARTRTDGNILDDLGLQDGLQELDAVNYAGATELHQAHQQARPLDQLSQIYSSAQDQLMQDSHVQLSDDIPLSSDESSTNGILKSSLQRLKQASQNIMNKEKNYDSFD